MGKTITITITGSNIADCTLTLSDGGITEAKPGDYIQWVLGPNCGVAKITGIIVDKGSNDVFNPDPAALPNSTTWKGQINPGIGIVEQESYTIIWIPTAGSGWLNQQKTCSYDPIIKVNPN